MKLAKSTWVKIGLILLLCVLVCAWLGGCLRFRDNDGHGFSLLPAGGVLGCMATDAAFDVVDGIVDAEFPDAPEAPEAPEPPTAPASPATTDWALGDFEVEASRVSAIELNWPAGKVNVRVVPDEETGGAIRATETLSGRAPQMRWELSSGGVLSINYMDGMRGFNGLSGCSNATMGSKELELLIPDSMQSDLQRFELEAASGEYTIDGGGNGVLCSMLELGVASGSVYVNDVMVNDLDVTLASGYVTFGGYVAQSLNIEQASGEFTFGGCLPAPERIAGSMASGHIVLELPADTSLAAKVDKTSGNFRNDFEGMRGDSQFPCDLDFEILSGNLEVIAA